MRVDINSLGDAEAFDLDQEKSGRKKLPTACLYFGQSTPVRLDSIKKGMCETFESLEIRSLTVPQLIALRGKLDELLSGPLAAEVEAVEVAKAEAVYSAALGVGPVVVEE